MFLFNMSLPLFYRVRIIRPRISDQHNIAVSDINAEVEKSDPMRREEATRLKKCPLGPVHFPIKHHRQYLSVDNKDADKVHADHLLSA